MALVFKRLTYDGIMELAQNPCPECDLRSMTFNEIEVLSERVDKIAKENQDDHELYAKLMRLKSFAMLEA